MALKQALAWVAATLVFAATLSAQATGSATVSGTVTDQSGAVIPGARVTLTSVDRGVGRNVTTNEAGIYLFPDLTPGNYSLRAQSDGFDTYELKAFRLEVDQRVALNVELQVGQVSNVVTVEAAGEAILLETESNALGTLVNSEQVQELPLNGRNFLQLALLAGGTNNAAGRADAGQIGHPGRSVVISGVKSTSNSYTINGIQVRGARKGELAVNLSIANVDEFQVQQSFFMPDQGPNPAMVNVNTKGGTNAFHGQAFEFLRNVELDARNFYAPGAENLKRNQFGFAVGGPIVKDKIWFYGGYEGLRERKAFAQGVYTPTQAMFGGNFGEVTQTIYDPLTLNESAGTRDPFPNNVIPTGRINDVSKGLLQYYTPGASLAQRPNNLFVNPLDKLDDDQFNVRVDTSLTDTQALFGQFIYSKSPSVEGGAFPLNGAFYPNELQMGMVQHTWTVSPSIVNTLRFGASRNVSLFSNEGRNSGDILGALGIHNTFDTRGVTSQGIQDYAGFGRANGDLGNLDNNYQLDEGMTYIHGSHQFRFGASIRYRRTWQQNSNAGAHGNLAYQKRFTARLTRNAQGALVPAANSGNAFADFLLGMPSTGSVRGLPMLPYRFTQYMPYIQDTWKVRRNFTVNWGLSWFKDTIADPQGEARDLAHGFDAQTGLLKFAALGEIDPKVISSDNNNFAPRLGFAWQLNDKTVVRAGGGVYYSDQQLIELQFAAVGPPNRSIDIINTGDLIPTYRLGMNIFPALDLPPLDENFAENLPPGQAPFLLTEEGRTPYISQWNFSIQHTLNKNNFIELAYMGNSGHRQQNRYDFDQCIVGADLFCDRKTRPYLRYTSLLRADYNGNTNYNAFVSKFQHRTAGGLNLRFEYTWAKGFTDSWEAGGATNAQVTNFRALDKDYASFDVRHRAVTSAIWEVPFGRGRKFGTDIARPLDFIAGGWTLTAITTFSTGVPFLLSTANTTGSPLVTHRPNRTCDGSLGGVNPRENPQFLDTSCFSVPQQGYFGTSSRNPLHGPGSNNWDIGIQKNFGITEEVRVQFRGEMFNAFNHTQFGNPNGNASSGNFGLIGSAHQPRLVQLGLKLLF